MRWMMTTVMDATVHRLLWPLPYHADARVVTTVDNDSTAGCTDTRLRMHPTIVAGAVTAVGV